MSNYPPGVTGMEWQIRGADERTIYKECNREANLTVMPWEIRDTLVRIASLRKEGKNYDFEMGFVLAIASENDVEVFVEECPFKGEVDVQIVNYIVYWQCPLCSHEHEEEIEEIEPPEREPYE